MTTAHYKSRFAICVVDDEPDLECGKVYRVLPDEEERRAGWLRVVDESGEDYMYPKDCFVFIELPRQVHKFIPGNSHSQATRAPEKKTLTKERLSAR